MTGPRRSQLDRTTAMRLAATEYERHVAHLRDLSTEDWSRPTDCPDRDVRAMATHVLGSARRPEPAAA
jgi:Mycothiol maleylpyruvate isomerase N-terminal domain